HPSLLLRFVLAPFGRFGTLCAGQFVFLLQRCPDHPSDDPAIMWSAQRSVAQFNAVLLAAASECFAFELGCIVDKQRLGFATHRPLGFHPQLFNHGRLSMAACARHSPTDTADGASRVTTMPRMHRLHPSMATVR